MLKTLTFTLAALIVVLMCNVYMGRAEEEPFEIVWKKDIGNGIVSYPLNDFQNLYVASDKTGNFLVYKDDEFLQQGCSIPRRGCYIYNSSIS